MISIKKNKLFFIILLSIALCAMRTIECGGIASCINPKIPEEQIQQEQKEPYYTKTDKEPGEYMHLINIYNNPKQPREIRIKALKKLGL
jgi:hypothetical protein